MSFAHLHVHSEYSLLDGAIKVADLVDRAEALGQPAVAITDHGWLAGAIKFVKAAKEKGIKPIVGSEIYVSTQEDAKKPASSPGDNYHLTLLAQTAEGYRNMMRMSSLAHLDGLSYKPRTDLTTLRDHAEGVICLSGCVGSQLVQTIVHGTWEEANDLVRFYQDTFEERFFIELMFHGGSGGIDHVRIEDDGGKTLMGETEINLALMDLANRHGVGVVATNDAHYLGRDDGCAHDTLLCIGMGAWKDKEDRLRFPGASEASWEFYIKGRDEMRAACPWDEWERACDNTLIVADMVEPDVVPFGANILPAYQIPDDVQYDLYKEHGLIL